LLGSLYRRLTSDGSLGSFSPSFFVFLPSFEMFGIPRVSPFLSKITTWDFLLFHFLRITHVYLFFSFLLPSGYIPALAIGSHVVGTPVSRVRNCPPWLIFSLGAPGPLCFLFFAATNFFFVLIRFFFFSSGSTFFLSSGGYFMRSSLKRSVLPFFSGPRFILYSFFLE